MSRPHVYIATPAYDGKVDSDYALSMAEAAQAATIHGINITAAVMGNGAFIDLARNRFVRIFLEETDCTHLFFIDADLKFEPRAFVGLVMSGHPVCAGAYRRRQEPEDYPVVLREHPEMGGLWVDNEWVMADRVPTGFLCIERSVLQEMSDKARTIKIHGEKDTRQLFYTKVNEHGGYVGEDFSWCDDYVAQYGKPIPVWPDFDFVHGGYRCNYYAWLAKRIEAEKKETSAA